VQEEKAPERHSARNEAGSVDVGIVTVYSEERADQASCALEG